MSELFDRTLRSLGVDPIITEVDLIARLIGGVLIVVGAVVVMRFVLDYLNRTLESLESTASTRLLPTLAEDALDDDLRQIYEKTRRLDTRIAEHAAEFSSHTGSRLGRAVRRYLVGEQARRFKASQSARQEKDEPPEQEARLDGVDATVDEAISAVEAQSTRAEPLADLLDRLAQQVEWAQK